MKAQIVLLSVVTAVCIGVLGTRLYDKWSAENTYVPPPVRQETSVCTQDPDKDAGTPCVPPAPSSSEAADVRTFDGGAYTWDNCMRGARRRGVNEEQAKHACDEIMN